MRRPAVPFCAAFLLGFLPAGVSSADDPPKPAPPAPKVAANEEARAAISRFKEEFRTKDVEAKLDAIDGLSKTNHPDVVEELGKLLVHRNRDVRSTAVQGLARQKALPALAGKKAATSIEANIADWEHLTDVIDAIRTLPWRGGLPVLVKLFRHEEQPVVRWALDAVGQMKDVRALDAVLDLMKELKIDEGIKWEGGEVRVDTGAAGSADADAARAAYEAKYGGKKRAASAGRKMRALGEIVYDVLKDLTGQEFASGKAAREWAEKNKADLDAKKKALDAEQASQDASAAEAVKAAKAGK